MKPLVSRNCSVGLKISIRVSHSPYSFTGPELQSRGLADEFLTKSLLRFMPMANRLPGMQFTLQ